MPDNPDLADRILTDAILILMEPTESAVIVPIPAAEQAVAPERLDQAALDSGLQP